MSLEADAPHRRIRSFVRREGRMTDGQRLALESLWPTYGLDAPAQPLAPATLFGREAPVVFEIGFGNGDHLLSRALNEPQHDFIGVEVHRPGCGRVMMLAEKQGSTNLRVACHDAVEVLRDWLVPGSLAEVVIYFPDPWHKKRHNKRRLVQPEFLALIVGALKPGGLLRMATDWAPYAEHMLESVRATPELVNLAPGGAYAERAQTRPKTRFEARGERLGHEVFDLLLQKR
ncbi:MULTISPECIES: tRNA (guanosine(46)-N7)-methyltransferase TrmB [Hydrocarboniphaga]|uniref:tRNA (guanine-N(7)-)-methyltransferase n=1 Tax=Hydrocarboniphaga effusa AP103 TaxID=1172194 RepID=I7ZB30_9GAMM|nr:MULTISPECIES: tRNA (guanosine(46)-N7)-methyltransferase TrmB [Hydrocarboniphaga]EIT68872.1 tRNA (guanine-N(7)-)-methyltransferase [Hydrocarboniphaga effusa AP103]MDZ4077728.1 tRNA (guanosine(46)-N7)-methyltransferase TrmB [Hydrocarboniphaga sp.]